MAGNKLMQSGTLALPLTGTLIDRILEPNRLSRGCGVNCGNIA